MTSWLRNDILDLTRRIGEAEFWNMVGAMVLIPALGHLLLKRQTAPEDSAAFMGALGVRP